MEGPSKLFRGSSWLIPPAQAHAAHQGCDPATARGLEWARPRGAPQGLGHRSQPGSQLPRRWAEGAWVVAALAAQTAFSSPKLPLLACRLLSASSWGTQSGSAVFYSISLLEPLWRATTALAGDPLLPPPGHFGFHPSGRQSRPHGPSGCSALPEQPIPLCRGNVTPATFSPSSPRPALKKDILISRGFASSFQRNMGFFKINFKKL